MGNLKVNGLIFKELIKRGYSLEGNTRVWNIADSKLWYLTPEQAKAYLAAEDSEVYKRVMVDNEIDLLKETMPGIMKKLNFGEEITIVDVGCGDGKKAIVPINVLKEKHKIRYCPIDISSYMVQEAIKNISKLNVVDEVIDFHWNVSDFENLENVTELLRQGNKDLFILFLGSTLGNFDTHDLLYAFQNSMSSGDNLLMGVSLDEHAKPDKIAASYINPEADNFMSHVLLELGFKKEEMSFGARYRNGRVECFYTISVDKTIKFQEREIIFNNGDQIIVSYSNKYNHKELDRIIELYFDNYTFYTNKKKDWALILCRK